MKSVEGQTNTSQVMAAARQYDAFGNILISSPGWTGPFGYAGGFGYQEDPTGLRLLGHRYYDSSTGRFLTRDPIKDGRNWYTYAWNDPVRNSDPTGHAIPILVVKGVLWAWAAYEAYEAAKDIAEDPTDPTNYIGGIPRVGKPLKKLARAVEEVAESAPPIKPGASGGPGAGKPFKESTRREEINNNRGDKDKCTCVYCLLETDSPQVDHAIPRSRGGNNTSENAQIACPHCNQSKGNRDFPVNPPPGFTGSWPPSHWRKR